MKASNFLNIHLEIRELIYTIYLTSPDPLPPSSVTRAHRISRGTHHDARWFGGKDDNDDRFFSEHCNHYPDPVITPAMPSSLPLLLCNRQIHREVSSIIHFLTTHTKKLRYEIDCEIVDEVKLYPTWLHIPVRFAYTSIPCLYVTFRISGQFDDDDGRRSGWARRSGGPGRMIWSIMALFNRFLMIGPNFIRPRALEIEIPPPSTVSRSTSNQPSQIKLLLNRLIKGNIQIDKPRSPTIPNNSVKSTQVSPEIRIDDLILDFAPSQLPSDELGARRDVAGEMIDPMQVATFVKEQLNSLFDGSVWYIQSGKYIASRVKNVHLLCCGKEVATWDLSGTTQVL